MSTKTNKTTETSAGPKFTVSDLVEATGLQPASVRVALRELSVEKGEGGKYGWNTKRDFDEVVKAMKERSAKRVTSTDTTTAPAKPAKAKAPAKPKTPKGKAKD